MIEKICPATGEQCLTHCQPNYCYINRISPNILEAAIKTADQLARKYAEIIKNNEERKAFRIALRDQIIIRFVKPKSPPKSG